MKKCVVCGTLTSRKKAYNRHLEEPGLKQNLRNVRDMTRSAARSLPGCKKLFKQRPWDIFRGSALLCDHCGHGIMESAPSPEALNAYYGQDYWSDRVSSSQPLSEERPQAQWRAEAQFDFLLRALKAEQIMSVLEIGAAHASTSRQLRERIGPELKLSVIEPGQQFFDFYAANGISHVGTAFSDAIDQTYSLVLMSHSLEHMPDLQNAIASIDQLTEAGGHVFIEVPNCGDGYWDVDWKDVPHIQFFTAASLTMAFEEAGFETLLMEKAGSSYQERVLERQVPREHYGAREKGCFLRAVFAKKPRHGGIRS